MYKYVFGPVPSRRLGLSLGVDLVETKTCNLNCIYCECGPNSKVNFKRDNYVDIDILKAELTKALEVIKPDYITFSGGGEPTLNKGLGRLVTWIKENYPYKIALITNSTLLNDPEVIEEIKDIDLIMPSLDGVTEKTFKKINRPSNLVPMKDILNGIKLLCETFKGKIYLELFIVEGVNTSFREIEGFISFIKGLKRVDSIQLNTLARPGAIKDIKEASFETLYYIKKRFLENGISNISILKKRSDQIDLTSHSEDEKGLLLSMLERRGYYIWELESVFNSKSLRETLTLLEDEGKISISKVDDNSFVTHL